MNKDKYSRKKIKIAMYGNVCNNFFALAKALNMQNDIEAHLYLDTKSQFQFNPENDDSTLIGNEPSWIHTSKIWNPFGILRRVDFRFVRELRKYDVVILSDFGLILANFLWRPKVIFFVTGMDLTRIPFPKRYLYDCDNVLLKLKRSVISLVQRFGIKACDLIIAAPFIPFLDALQRLGVTKEQVAPSYYPILINTDRFQRGSPKTNISGSAFSQLQMFDFVIFHPTRIITETAYDFVETGHYKGNEILLEGFADFLNKSGAKNTCLALIDRAHNKDVVKFKELIEKLKIKANVVWLTPPSDDGFTREELIDIYSVCQVVADDFGVGWFGSIVVEACAMGLPVICHVDSRVMKHLYPSHPILDGSCASEISFILQKLYFDPVYRESIGIKSREWAKTYHSLDSGGEIYIKNMHRDGILSRDNREICDRG